MKKLTDPEIETRLKSRPSWYMNKVNQIERLYELTDFKESIFFVNSVAHIAEKLNHHPDIVVRWNRVLISVNTHDANGITELDFKLAQLADDAFEIKRH
jgi:4a-hydroxytetrahydrobiopterin dehydratase